MRSRLTWRGVAGGAAFALLALLLCTAGGALAQATSGLANATVSPAHATMNSIYNFGVDWTKSQLPFSGRWITLSDPRLVQVDANANTVKFLLPNFTGADNHHEVWTAAGYNFEPLRVMGDTARKPGELGALEPLGKQDGRLTDQGGDPDAQGWRTVSMPDPPQASDAENEVWAEFPSIDGVTVTVASPNGEPITEVLGVWDNKDQGGTNYFKGAEGAPPGAFTPDGQITLGTALAAPGTVWVWFKYERQYAFDPADATVIVRVAATPVYEGPLTPGLYWANSDGSEDPDVPKDRRVFYVRATPVVGISGVFSTDTSDLTNYYGAGSYSAATGQIVCESPIPDNITAVEIVYWIGPVTLSGPGGEFDDLDGNTVPFSAADVTDSGRYAVSGSRGMNLQNDVHAAPGLWLLTSPGRQGNTWSVSDIEPEGDGTRKVSDDKAVATNGLVRDRVLYGRFLVNSNTLSATGPTVEGSRTGSPTIRERVLVDDTTPNLTSFTISPPNGAQLREVRGVWLDKVDHRIDFGTPMDIYGTFDKADADVNFFTGGVIVQPGPPYLIQLGSSIPAATPLDILPRYVWIEYAYTANARWGGGGSQDFLYAMGSPVGGSDPPSIDPLIVEQYTRSLPADYIRTATNRDTGTGVDQRQFIPFNQAYPDDGTSSNSIAFRIQYGNNRDLPPSPWMPANGRAGATGVQLFLKYDGQPDYTVYGLGREDPVPSSPTGSYLVKFEPSTSYRSSAKTNGRRATRYETSANNYIAMPVGQHQYFYGASDDVLFGRSGGYYTNPLAPSISPATSLEQNPPPFWPGAAPSLVNTFNFADRLSYQPGPDTGYSARMNPSDPNDRRDKLAADQHPVIHALLSGVPIGQTSGALPAGGILTVPSLATTQFVGTGYYMGTLSPFRRAVHPTFQWPTTGEAAGIPLGGTQLIESCGGTTATVFTFRVIYQSFDPVTKIGRAPQYIKVFIDSTPDGTGQYGPVNIDGSRGATMSPTKSNPTPDDYKNGLIYEYKTKLAAGSHSYYFEADSGFGPVRFPVRPDGRRIEAPAAQANENPPPSPIWTVDAFVPGAADLANNNDFCSGPYVNSKPVLSNWSVTPASGALGTEFVYKVTYTDADNQRPFQTDIIIETATGTFIRAVLQKVNASNNNYAQGVEYQYRVSSVQAAAFALGIRRYRFEFTDDWGRATDLNDLVQGETVQSPTGANGAIGWVDGPTVADLKRPQLFDAAVTSSDGTSNADTLWTYEVRYVHANNTPPTYVSLYIGSQRHADDPANAVTVEPALPLSLTSVRVRVLPVASVMGVYTTPAGTGTNYFTGGAIADAGAGDITLGTPLPDGYTGYVWVTYSANPIIWDDGHPMVKRDAGDNVYTDDGVVFEYETKLPGADDATIPIKYYFTFQSSDGRFVTVYNPTTSPGAFARTRQSSGEGATDTGEILAPVNSSTTIYGAEFAPAVGPLPASAEANPGVLLEPAVYVYHPGEQETAAPLVRERIGLLEPGDPAVAVSQDGSSVGLTTADEQAFDVADLQAILGVQAYDNQGILREYFNSGSGGSVTFGDPGPPATATITLGTPLPAGIRSVFITYLTKGAYRLAFANGQVFFNTPVDPADVVEMEYWWAQEGPDAVGVNSPPILTSGSFTPDNPTGIDGNTRSPFTFGVVYTDTDGSRGQAPTYVRVVIDGVAVDMTPTVTLDPDYSAGVLYTYTTTLSDSNHRFYFVASDGSGFAVFDLEGSKSSGSAITDIVQIPGPVVTEQPILTGGTFTQQQDGNNKYAFVVTYAVKRNVPPSFIYLLIGRASSGQKQVTPTNATTVVMTLDDPNTPGVASPKLLGVVGVWTNPSGSGVNYYTGGSFDPATGRITLGTAAPSGTTSVYVTYYCTPITWAPEGPNIGRIPLVKQNPLVNTYSTGVVYTTQTPLTMDGPATGNPATDPSKLYYYAFEASDGVARAEYRADGSGSAYDAEADILTPSTDLRTFSMDFNGYVPNGAVPANVWPFAVVVGPLDAAAGGVPNVVTDPIVTLTDTSIGPGSTQTLLKGDGALKTQYKIDYATGRVILGAPALAFDQVKATYWFARPLPLIAYNVPPSLSGGQVLPISGSSASTFTYTVNYREPDGTPPTYVEVVIDGTPYSMTRTSGGATPNYANNISYQFQTSTLAPATAHNFYFRASDGIGYAVFDGATPQARNSTGPITVTQPISGPTVLQNNTPTLTNAQASPSTDLSLPDTQWTFQVTYSDIDNNAPGFMYLLLGQATGHSLETFNSSGTTTVTVTPVDPGTAGEAPPRLVNVVGVWDNPTGSGTNYYTGGTFDAASGVVTLGTALSAPGPVYVTYHSTPILWTPEGTNRGRIALIKLDPSDSIYTDGVIYTTSAAIKFDGPASGNVAAHPPKLNYYAFEGSDGIVRASYTASGSRPSPAAFGVESDALVTGDRQTYQMTYSGFPASARPNPLLPVVVGPLISGAASQALVLEKPLVTLTPAGGSVQTLTQGDLAVKTQYEVDYALGLIRLGAQAAVDDTVRASYWFGQPLPVVGYNSPPRLTAGRVSPEVGSRFTTYTYTVTYTETDGLNGTAPSYMRVVIDGTAYAMERVTAGQPIYRNGVEYRYQTTLAPNAAHRYRFEASDGYGFAVYDALPVASGSIQFNAASTLVTAAGQNWTPSEFKNTAVVWYTGKRAGIHDAVLDNTGTALTVNGVLNADPATTPQAGDQFKLARSRSSLSRFDPVGDIEGPYLNDAPYLSYDTGNTFDTGISPTAGVRRNTPVTYSTWYHDSDDDGPADGYPMAWIGGSAWAFNGGIISRLYPSVTLITDASQAWSPSQFKNQPLTWITGKRVGLTDTILDNTSNTLIVSGRLDADITTRPEVSDRFGMLQSTGTASAIDYTAAGFLDDTKAYVPGSLAGRRVQMVIGGSMGAVFTVAANTSQMLAIGSRQLPTASTDPDVIGTGVASGDSYSIHDILVGAVTLNLNDGGVVSMKFGNSPGWVTDQFAGLVIQMMSGPAVWKKYTILNNSADTLYFAQQASVFVNDGVQSGNIARIAGLKMDKVSAGENDYTVAPGVQYTVTVPGLGVGDHSVRWMVSNSPRVRGVRTTFQNKLPASSSQSGPLVTEATPPGNVAPQLAVAVATPSIGKTTDNYAFSVRYLDADGDPPGPHDGVSGFIQLVVDAEINGQIVRRTYRSSVDPVTGGSWPANVYRTIDASVFSGFLIDASVAPLPPGNHRFHFEASDGWSVVRFPSNAANDPSVVVNSRPRLTLPVAGGVTPAQGNAGTTFRFRVIYTDGDNQAPSSISLVLTKNGVLQAPLLMTQEVPSDVNYADGAVYYVDTTLAAATYAYQFVASDPVESADPTQPQSGPVVRATNNAPVLLNGAVTPAVSAFAGNAFTYSVNYQDQDNDPPNFVRLTVFAADGTTVLDTLEMARADAGTGGYSGAQGVVYQYPGYHFGASGSFFYQFSASDGTSATGDVAKKSGPVVNTPPVLSAPGVDKMSGLSNELFTFTVTYTDANNLAPTVDGYVRLVLVRGATVTRVDLTPQAASGWASGVQYLVETQLAAGSYSFYFEASDGFDAAASTPQVLGLSVTATSELRSAAVAPAVGKSTDTYSYTVTLANPSGTGPDEILVFIDGTDDASSHVMSKVNPSDMNFAAGVQYIYQATLAPSASIPGGKHTWFIRAKVAGQTIFPPGQNSSTPSIGPRVNSAPVLTEATINPTFGRPADTPFTFQVTFADADRVAPAAGGYVRVVVSGVPYQMSAPASPDWTKPVIYTVTTTLPGAQHKFFFEASDGIETTRLPSGTGQFDGPRVSTRPSLTNGSVTPDSGTTATSFTYSVTYSDPEGDSPSANGVQVLIDGQPYTMTRAAGVPNYVTGVLYTYSTTLGAGAHNFMFQASDGIDLVTSALQTGKPLVDVVGLTVNVTPNPAALGSVITVSGEVLPKRAVTLNVVLDRPIGANVNRTVTTNAAGAYSFTFVTDEVGIWDVRITDPSTAAFASISPKLTVNKATLRVQGGVVDMISSPVSSPTGDPSVIFGSAAALALNIVRWLPASAAYKFYGVDLDFPVLNATSAFWVKPAATTTLELSGTLQDQTRQITCHVAAGWNQIGSGFVKPVNWADIQVRYGSQGTVSMAEAETRGWVRAYSWGYDPLQKRYFLVRASGGESSTLEPFRGYWMRAFVECDLLIQPPAQ